MCNLLTVDIKSGEDMLVEGDSEGSHRGRAGAKEGLTEGEDTGEELPQHLVNRERQGEEVDMMAKLSYSDKSSPVPRLYSFTEQSLGTKQPLPLTAACAPKALLMSTSEKCPALTLLENRVSTAFFLEPIE